MKSIQKIIFGLLVSVFIFSNITYLYAQFPYKLVSNNYTLYKKDNNKEYLQFKKLVMEANNYLENPIIEKMVSAETIKIINTSKTLNEKSSKKEIIDQIKKLENAINQLKSLKNKEIPSRILEEVIPDKNFRQVIINYLKGELTINSLENIKGELYASCENISSIEGVEVLKNIESIILWKNNLTKIPDTILRLNNLNYLNVKNNYITESKVIDSLEKRGVNIESDLNFIKNKNNQYNLKSKEDFIVISKDGNVDLKKYIYKDILGYSRVWEITDELYINKFEIITENKNIIDVNNMNIKGKNIGTTMIYIKTKEINTPILITLTVKVK